MPSYEHLDWSVKSQIKWLDATTKQSFDKTIESQIDVWIGTDSTFYRVEMPIVGADNNLTISKQELELRGKFAIIQTYDCRNPNSKDMWDVCNINVIPAFGDTRISNVNYLQFPTTELLTRLMLLGRVPKTWNEVQFESGPEKFELSTWDQQSKQAKIESEPGAWTLYKGRFVDHQLNSIAVINGFSNKPLRTYGDIRFKNDRIVSFSRSEESEQAKKLLRPSTFTSFALTKMDTESPDFQFRKGANVFDFRLCKPVALNQFPNLDCRPKVYFWEGHVADEKVLEGLSSGQFNTPPPPKSNSFSPYLLAICILSILCLIGSLWKFKWKKTL